MNRTRRLAAALGSALLAGTLAACVPDVPQVDPEPEPPAVEPVLDQPRLDRVLEDIQAHLDAADAEGDIELMRDRVENPALRVRSAEYRLERATAETDQPSEPQPLTTSSQVSVVAATQEWPRTLLVVTEIPEESNAPLLIGVRQDAPRDPYRLFSWVRLLPGVTMPATEIPDVGSAPVAPDAEEFLVTPQSAIEQYAEVLTDFDDAEFADQFEQDPFRELVEQEVTAAAEGVEEAGEFTHSTQARDEPVVALRTADGGAVVLGALTTRHTYTKDEPDGELEVGGQLAALSENDGEVEESLEATFHLMVALYVPAEEEDATVTVLGAERALGSVEES